MAVTTTKFPRRAERARSTTHPGAKPHPSMTDDEILGLVTTVARPGAEDDEGESGGAGAPQEPDAGDAENDSGEARGDESAAEASAEPEGLREIFDAKPELRRAWHAERAYRKIYPTPQAAHEARRHLAALDHLDSLFYSARPEDHARLAATLHKLSPGAFARLTRAMQRHAARSGDNPAGGNTSAEAFEAPDMAPTNDNAAGAGGPAQAGNHADAAPIENPAAAAEAANASPAAREPGPNPSAAQLAFFHNTNAAAVEQILGAIHAQVERLLPEAIGEGTRNRIVGEIYRELDGALRSNRELARQLREAFRSGAGDAAHQRSLVGWIVGRAKQALPAVAKKVIGEWTSSVLASSRERLERHTSASKRVDIAGAGSSDGVSRKPLTPRDINYRKLSDADILNL